MKGESVKLSWLPARTSNLPENARKISYTIEARELPSNRWTRLATGLDGTNFVARHLRPDKEYMFRVYADNKYGSSEPTLPATLPAREGMEITVLPPNNNPKCRQNAVFICNCLYSVFLILEKKHRFQNAWLLFGGGCYSEGCY